MRSRASVFRRLLLGAVAAWAIPAGAAAQAGCRFADDGNDELNAITAPGGDRITYVRNAHFLCDDGVQIWADSAVTYSAESMSILVGSVRYRDRARELRSDQARYFSTVGRLQAQGRLHVTNADDGSVIENGDLVYLREADYRAEEEMVVTTGRDGLRPRAMVRPDVPDSVAADADPPSPYTVIADRIVLRGAGYFNATGTVEIERDSLFAFADSAEYEETFDRLVLVRSARVESAAYELVGRTITLGTAESGSNEIRALRDAVLTGEDLTLTAPQIVLHLTDGAIERLVAVPIVEPDSAAMEDADLSRPVAIAEGFELTADSVELTAPAEVVERIFAAGTARSVSHARDSLNVEALPELARYDWLEGDTIVVMLRPTADSMAAPADNASGGAYEVERIVARVGARSLYRLPPEDSTAVAGVDPPAVHYVMGDEITIVMNVEGEVEVMEVVGQTRGVHLEPLGPGGADAPADSLGVQSPDAPTMTLNDSRTSATDPTTPRPPGAPLARGVQPWIRP
jgi:lipopolysaccharide export system protein LptA